MTELPKNYDPSSAAELYKFWLDKGYFHAEVDPSREKYSITIPPPNVTGSLHIGHALGYTIHDVLVRRKRMQGFNVLCLPGTDHAGIATQNKVEQKLAKEGLTRHDIGREKFLERVWDWKNEYGAQILNQFRTMGYSFDWDRERFTMDEGYSAAVKKAFVTLFNKGYIYRGARVINWCPRCMTAISDIEVEYKDQPSHLWHFKYPFEDGSGYVVVATTRPETMLGDTAVAVNPGDKRYEGMVGKMLRLPLVDRLIPIVADDYVDLEFGTGAVKVTPAHDPNDFEIGMRHNLEQIHVIGNDGKMTAEAGKYAGLDRDEARKQVVADIDALGLLDKIEDYSHNVGTCARCGTTIEPMLSEQWFCKMKELAGPAIEAVTSGAVKFHPDRYAKTYLEWMENVRDWCISRQLWWGHQIPVWKCEDCGKYTASEDECDSCSHCGSKNVTRETDVLDTWFSSALWPFATMGWPLSEDLLDYFYPTDVLITARDIIYLWVARMIFSSLEYRKQIPFKDVYIYATVMNEEGKRMSKSLSTGVDPLELVEKYGVDSLRFALISQAGKNQDMRFSDKRVENVRGFANKIWNASRFVIMNLEGYDGKPMDEAKLETADKWILSRLNDTVKAANKGFDNYDMDDAARAIYDFMWNEFCDWYIELAKPRLREEGEGKRNVQAVLTKVLETSMRLLHPIMPFITEEIWQAIPHEGESVMVASYPEADDSLEDKEAEAQMSVVMDLVRAVRNIRAEIGAAPSKPVPLTLICDGDKAELVKKAEVIVKSLAKVDEITFADAIAEGDKGKFMSAHFPGCDIYVPMAGLVDVEKEKERIANELKSVEKDLSKHQAKLDNEKFMSKAPEEIKQKEINIVKELTETAAKLKERLASL
ncbi:MAG: valine--tRNA ligase [Abditibacteriota bacterium]|nr:valine--tRNA ligase [Abditibacteriota bacterium]